MITTARKAEAIKSKSFLDIEVVFQGVKVNRIINIKILNRMYAPYSDSSGIKKPLNG